MGPQLELDSNSTPSFPSSAHHFFSPPPPTGDPIANPFSLPRLALPRPALPCPIQAFSTSIIHRLIRPVDLFKSVRFHSTCQRNILRGLFATCCSCDLNLPVDRLTTIIVPHLRCFTRIWRSRRALTFHFFSGSNLFILPFFGFLSTLFSKQGLLPGMLGHS